jgi:hypothetical protein
MVRSRRFLKENVLRFNLTAHFDDPTAGADEYLAKPFDTGELLARLSDSCPLNIGGEEDVILFFAEDSHGFYAGGAKRGNEGGDCGDDEDEQDDGRKRGKVGGGNTVEEAGEEASGGNCQGKAGEAAHEADGQSLPEKSFNDLAG